MQTMRYGIYTLNVNEPAMKEWATLDEEPQFHIRSCSHDEAVAMARSVLRHMNVADSILALESEVGTHTLHDLN